MIDALAKIDSNVPFMMPERLAHTDPNTQITEAIGSGPFRFNKSAWVPGVKVVYEKFGDYIPRDEPASQAAGGKRVKVDAVELVYTPDSATAANALINAEFDLLENPGPDLVPLLKRSPDIVVRTNDPLGYQLFMVLNHLQPPFRQPRRSAGVADGDTAIGVHAGQLRRQYPVARVSGCVRLHDGGDARAGLAAV